jgi:RNA polymerase sigma-70 factor (ECF subfamily)
VVEAFDTTYNVLHEFAAYFALVLGVIATLSPTLMALSASVGRVRSIGASFAARANAERAYGAIHVLQTQPRPELGREGQALAQDTRGLVLSLAHQRKRQGQWLEMGAAAQAGLPRWRQWLDSGRDAEFGATIGATGELWHWLGGAEAYADGPEFASLEVAEVAAFVRQRLFAEDELGHRLDDILGALVRLDTGFRACETTPYRGRSTHASTTPVPLAALDEEQDEEDEQDEQTGFDRRWREVTKKHAGAIRAIAARYAGDLDSRKDLEQEISLAVWKAMPSYRAQASLKTYALRIAHYCGSRFRRRQPRFTSVDPDVGANLGGLDASVDPEASPEERLERERRRARLHRAMAELSRSQREALQLQLQGLSYREIAQRLEISESNASVRITRARKALHRKLSLA